MSSASAQSTQLLAHCIIMCDYAKMSREELEEFADKMRIERNTMLLEKGDVTTVMDTHDFMEILKHLVQEKKDLQKRLDIMEEILHSYIPVLEKDES